MPATLRVTCQHKADHAVKELAPQTIEWANELNQMFRHPIARVDVRDIELAWNRTTDISVSSDGPHRLQVFMRAAVLHWCGAEIEIEPLRDGETQSFVYAVDFQGGWVRHGHLDRQA
jgi:hypothetical protein